MFSFTRPLLILPIVTTLCACATTSSRNFDGDKATYFESSFDDKNRAPASFAPAVVVSDEGGGGTANPTLDPFYMRTQADYYYAMGEAFSLDGNSTKAIESFKMTLLYDQNSPAVNMRLATEYLKQGMVSESLSQAEEAVRKEPKNVEAHLLLGGLYSSFKLYPRALEQYQLVLKLQPNNTEAPLYIGALYSEQKQADLAVKYFESLLKNPEYTTPHMAYYYIARVRSEQSETKYKKVAEENYKKALKLKPDFVDAVLSLGVFYAHEKKENAAVELYRRYQKDNSPSPKIAEVLAQMYLERGNYDLAYEQLEIVESQGSEESLNVKVKMALILIEQKKFTAAVDKLQDVLKQAPDSDKIRYYLAAVYEETQQPDKAIAEFKRIPATSTYFGEAVVHSAYLLKLEGKFTDAVDVVSKGLASRDDQPQVYAMYASLLDEKKDYKQAAQVLAKGLEKFPDNAQLRFYNGTVNDRLGKKDVVISEMKKVLEIDPDHIQGLNYLAFTFAEMGTNLPDAEKLARHALALNPQDGYILDTLGWVLYKQNKFTESVKFLEAAFKTQSTVSVIAEHLGDAYYKQSLVEKAKTMYRKAADLETDKKKVEEIRGKITAIENQELGSPRLPASVTEQK
jgi:tetratricopeptide (TPR) repeat protein